MEDNIMRKKAYDFVKVENLLEELMSSLDEIIDFRELLRNGKKTVKEIYKNEQKRNA